MSRSYLPILLLLGFVSFNAVLIIGLSALTLRARPTAVKQQPYESGMAPLGDARERFSVKFYLVAMLFIIFDIETVFMIPWGVAFRQLVDRRRRNVEVARRIRHHLVPQRFVGHALVHHLPL